MYSISNAVFFTEGFNFDDFLAHPSLAFANAAENHLLEDLGGVEGGGGGGGESGCSSQHPLAIPRFMFSMSNALFFPHRIR